MNWKPWAARALLLASATLCAFAAGAQSFPSRPVRIIVPYPAGGASDLLMRSLAEKLGDSLGQAVVVENRPGAGGNIGAAAAARSPADGYTLFTCNIASHGIGPAIQKKLPYDPEKDFAPISTVGSVANVLVVNPRIPVNNVAQFIAWAKAGADRNNFASAGVGTSPDMAMELLKVSAGIELTRVTYKGNAPALQDVIAGHLPTMFGSVGDLLSYIKAGQLRAVAVSSLQRNPSLPDVPTFNEAGVPGYEVVSWNHLCAPAGVPEPTLQALNDAVVKTLAMPETRERIARMGVQAESSTREALGTFMKSEQRKWRDVAKAAGISLDQ